MKYLITYTNDGGEEVTDAIKVTYNETSVDFTDENKVLIKRVFLNNLRELKLVNYTPIKDNGTKLMVHTVNDREITIDAFNQINDYSHIAVYNQDGLVTYVCNSAYINSFTIVK